MGVQCFVMNLAYWLHGAGLFSPTGAFVPTATLVLLGYAGVMLWLGGRALARFQSTDGMAGHDLVVAGPDVMSGLFGGWLRCRPTGAVLNLFRKEFRLLRPVWLINLLATLGWACLTLYGMTHKRGLTGSFQTALVITLVINTLMITILAGSLSLGEERTSGTHLWSLSLPAAPSFSGHQALHGPFRRLPGRGLAPAADRGATIPNIPRGCGPGNQLAARGGLAELGLLLVRVRSERDGARRAVGSPGGDCPRHRQ